MKKIGKNILILNFILIINMIFIDFVKADTYNNYSNDVVSCGNNFVTGIPASIPKVVSTVYIIIQIIVPVLLVILGMFDLFKGITAGKEDEMKKSQQTFIKRLVAAVIIFFVFVIVKLVISFAANASSADILECTECFIKNNDKCIKSSK